MLPILYDFAIVGGGIVGASTAYKLLMQFPDVKIVLLEKEAELARHQTGRNSGVIHSGIYYKPGSYKAKLCFNGREQLVAFAQQNDVPFDVCGKLILATTEEEVARLNAIYSRGLENGLNGLKLLTPKEFQEIEPFARGLAAVFVPQTGIIDFKDAVQKMKLRFLEQPQNKVLTNFHVSGISKSANTTELKSKTHRIAAKSVIFCGGLQADHLAELDGVKLDIRTIPFRGDYYDLTETGKTKVRNLIYPVPDPAFPFLGVHFTRMTDGSVECGPNAVFGFKREGYQRLSFSLADTTNALAFGGTWKLFAQHWRMGLHEQQRAWSKPLFLKALQKLIPDLSAADIVRSRSGVRAMTIKSTGEMVDDFLFEQTERHLHVLNAPSPAATAGLAIADVIVEKIKGVED
jgi:L-2-hydroxyglutarate oxidase LhgO